jgi:L-ascorbate metabolism protein UlaG (beta-lactamase superfamily)
MIISFQGKESFKVSQGDLVLSINPTNNRTKADVALFSTGFHENPDVFTITGPGEYEVKGTTVKGFLSEGETGKINTIYMINFEGINMCFLGALANPALPTKTLENLEEIDILFAPVGGEGALDVAAAYKLAVSLEPSIIIPMNYTSGDTLKKFLKEAGSESVTAIDKLVAKKKDLEGKEAEVVVLKEE